MKRFVGLLLSIGLLFLVSVTQAQSRLGVLRCAYVALPVKDLSASLTFYNTVLGLQPVAVPSALANSQAWFNIGGGQQIRLIEGRADGGAIGATNSRIALVVSSLRQAEQQLRQRNPAVARQVGLAGKPVIYITDPDGYQLELSEGKAESPGFLQSAAKTLWKSITTVE
ncbi:VOC family protein [Fibrella aquatilis]|uniref:VOC family protein n=1 Tax=Fibrella aquatilis TaxID=2817059 RepID=A0A939G613_9BACT|nr:VOC family protein [Fibrella aquatilis]MBO0932794.1 VOC family protein [Fibrella aquatilis]